MPVYALVTWIITALGGLFLLAIWLIEYDPEYQRAAATRLPVPVISGHVLCAVGGLVAWILYIVTDQDRFAWMTVVVLGAVATLGVTMAIRWVGVYRSVPLRMSAATRVPPASQAIAVRDAWTPPDRGWDGAQAGADLAVPPERHFPLPVVIGHGVFALITIVLVLLTVIGVGAS